MPRPGHRLLVVTLVAVASAAGCGRPPASGVLHTIKVGGAAAAVEVAADPETRTRGLSGRTSLPDGQGMLFFFPKAAVVSFWMKDTHVPLSIAFITPDGKIAEIKDMRPESLETHSSSAPVAMALEMPGGWFGRNGVRPGDAVLLPEPLLTLPAR